MINIFVVDVETGGLDENESPLLEVGVEHLATGERKSWPVRCGPVWLFRLVKRWPWLAKRFGMFCHPLAMELNGRNPESGFRLKYAICRISSWIEYRRDDKTKPAILAGMNPAFDLRFLREAWKSVDLQFPFSHRTIDLHTLAIQKAIREHPEINLAQLPTDAIYAMAGEEPEIKPHTAIEGVRREARLFRRFL